MLYKRLQDIQHTSHLGRSTIHNIKIVKLKMTTYKLKYFPVRARGEVSRLLFAVTKTPYEDEKIPFSDWPKLKKDMINGHIPILEVNNTPYCQSTVIQRYLASKFGLRGKTDEEQAHVDEVLETAADLLSQLIVWFLAPEGTPKKTDERTKLVNETFPNTMVSLTKLWNKNGSTKKYFVGESLTVADLAVYEITNQYSKYEKLDFSSTEYKRFLAHQKLVEENENLKSYVDKRPQEYRI